MGNRIIPKIEPYNKIDVVSFVQMKLKGDDRWAKRACVAIHKQQTRLERINHLSSGRDHWGFSRNDAPILSKIAGSINSNHKLSENDIRILHLKMYRYARQLICIICQSKISKQILKNHLDIYYKKGQTKLPF